MHGCDVEHHAALSRNHALQRGASTVIGPEQVDLQYLGPSGRIVLPPQGTFTIDAGVVDQDVDAAPLLVELSKHRVHGRRVRHVGLHRQRTDAVLLDLANRGLRLVWLSDIVDCDIGARRCEFQRDRLTDPSIAAGNEGTLVLKLNLDHSYSYSEWYCQVNKRLQNGRGVVCTRRWLLSEAAREARGFRHGP